MRGDSSGSSTTIDPKGYLTDLDSIIHKTEAEIGDTKRGRTLLMSLTKTNPKHAPGWIAAARLEEVAGKMVAARKIIDEGTKNCPKSEEVWREAARLNVRIVVPDALLSCTGDADDGDNRPTRTQRLSSPTRSSTFRKVSTSGSTLPISRRTSTPKSGSCEKLSNMWYVIIPIKAGR
jgi:hypothetical protein